MLHLTPLPPLLAKSLPLAAASRYMTKQHQIHHKVDNTQSHNWSILTSVTNQTRWNPQPKYACLLLNLNSQQTLLRCSHLWNAANFKVAIDGSANLLARCQLIDTADLICGDFDSIDKQLLESLQSNDGNPQKPKVITTPDQNETDFTKAIKLVSELEPDIKCVLGLYENNGSRLDHIFGLINTLHKMSGPILMVDVNRFSVSWILEPGEHVIEKPKGSQRCSLVPFTGVTRVETQNLKYDLSREMALKFGQLISTSNSTRVDSDLVVIKPDRKLLFTIDLESDE